ncbi:hypothetical protein AB3N59_14135 [Leptospira sp. WS92.C1]
MKSVIFIVTTFLILTGTQVFSDATDDIIAEEKKKELARIEEKLEPYKKVLPEGKLAVVRENKMYNYYLYGAGKKTLSIEGMKDALVWFKWTYRGTGLNHQWWLTRYEFDRSGKLLSTTTKEGGPAEPTAKEFQ